MAVYGCRLASQTDTRIRVIIREIRKAIVQNGFRRARVNVCVRMKRGRPRWKKKTGSSGYESRRARVLIEEKRLYGKIRNKNGQWKSGTFRRQKHNSDISRKKNELAGTCVGDRVTS